MEENRKPKNIFEEAAMHAINAEEIIPIEPIESDREILEAIVQEEIGDEWKKLAEAMDGEFAKKMLTEMRVLKGKTFVMHYMKMLEFFKPKVTRIEGNIKTQEEKVLRVEYITDPKQLEKPKQDEQSKENIQE
jgi:hypothetical protein